MLGIKQLFITAYHSQANCQAEKFKKIITPKLRHYITDLQKDWDAYVSLFMYFYNDQVHCSSGTSHFNLALSVILPSAVIATHATAHVSDGSCQAPTAAHSKRATVRWY